jgi:hypothetical protein
MNVSKKHAASIFKVKSSMKMEAEYYSERLISTYKTPQNATM